MIIHKKIRKNRFYPLTPSSTYTNGSTRCSLAEMNGKSQQQQQQQQPRYASTISLRSLAASDASLGCTNGLRNSLDYSSASLINLQDQIELERVSVSRRRSPSLPPIYSKEEYRYQVRVFFFFKSFYDSLK